VRDGAEGYDSAAGRGVEMGYLPMGEFGGSHFARAKSAGDMRGRGE